MKAIRIHGHGGPEALIYEEAPRPTPGPGEVLVKVEAAGVNPADHKHRDGMFKDFVKYEFPKILGYDVAGAIAAVGDGVTGLQPGTRVLALLDPLRAGGYAEYVVTDAGFCARMPDGMDYPTAVAIPCPGLTGVQFVEDVLQPKPGDRVLVTGATGMVGRFAMMAAKAAGATVIAGVRAQYADAARAMGADEIAVLDGTPYSGAPFDGVIDTVGGEVATALAAGARSGARILTAATTPLDPARLPTPPEFIAVHPDGARLEALAASVAAGKVDVEIVETLPLREAAKAQQMMEAGGVRGKIVLVP